MGKYRVVEEWTNYRIVEIDAASEDEAVDLVQDGHGNEVDGGTDNHYTEARLLDPFAVGTVIKFDLPPEIAGYLAQIPKGGY